MFTFIVFWLDFQGLGLPGELKKRKIQFLKIQRFSEVKNATLIDFYAFRLVFEVIFESPRETLRYLVWLFFWEGLQERSRTTFGSIFEPFGAHCGSHLGIVFGIET